LGLKKFRDTIKECNYLIKNKKNDASAYFIRGGAYYEMNKNDQARKDWNNAVKLAKPGSYTAIKAEQNLQLLPAK
jgi:tetratricopeptide (TPR) repeat protein